LLIAAGADVQEKDKVRMTRGVGHVVLLDRALVRV
jgi:hypothetical protein